MLKYEEDFRKFGLRIKYFRQKKNMEQVDFAGEVGISPQYLSKIECAHVSINMELFFKIADCLEVDKIELLRD